MKQTSADWLENELLIILPVLDGEYLRFFKESIEHAKEMRKQQIIDAYEDGYRSGFNDNRISGEQYYNDTFNK
jgi:hypothetical protein